MIPLVVIRPEPGCTATVERARQLRFEAQGWPLFTVSALGWSAAPPDSFDALLLGSANALRQAGPRLDAYRHLPVYAVGEATARAAREAGFAVAAVGSGGLQAVLGLLEPGHRRLLRPSGEERVPLTLPDGVSMEEPVVYRSSPEPMPAALAVLLNQGAVVALHSGEAARHLAAECGRLGVRRARVTLAALAPRIASAAGDGWRERAVAARPDDEALLALASQMCQEADPAQGQ